MQRERGRKREVWPIYRMLLSQFARHTNYHRFSKWWLAFSVWTQPVNTDNQSECIMSINFWASIFKNHNQGLFIEINWLERNRCGTQSLSPSDDVRRWTFFLSEPNEKKANLFIPYCVFIKITFANLSSALLSSMKYSLKL